MTSVDSIVLPGAGGGSGATPMNQCRRFQANMFSKIRCQHCFKARESHSNEALDNGKVTWTFFNYY
jgi:hypothetical protein